MNKLGQYFTTDESLKYAVLDFIKNNPKKILEPSIGQGDLVKYITYNTTATFDMYEIDESIKLLDGINRINIVYQCFINANITKKYKTIIGNPPYVKKSTGNLYLEFIEKCFNLLKQKGELIFIIPSEFFKLTSSCKLIETMLNKGSFTHIYHPNKENLFKNAYIDVLVFRYCKDITLPKKVMFNGEEKFIINSSGMVTFENEISKATHLFKDYFDIHVGIVSGKDAIYKNSELGNIDVLCKKDLYAKFILTKTFPSNNKKIDEYLLLNKGNLMKRKIKKFTEKNWFEWGAPRNIKKMEMEKGKSCIYIHNLTRKEEVAFLGKVDYFGGNLIILIPKKNCDLKKVVSYLNSISFKKNFIYSGRFKIGHRQLSNSIFNV